MGSSQQSMRPKAEQAIDSEPMSRLLYIMLAFFRAFQWGKSIEDYSSILVAFSQTRITFHRI